MAFSVSINFDGNCREAVAFYAEAFQQAPPSILTYREGDASFDSNVRMSEAGLDRVMHAELSIAGTRVAFSDMPDCFVFERGNSLSLCVTLENPQKAEALFGRLCAGGQAFVPFGNIPGQGWYGMLGDRFGLSWIVRA